MLDIAENEYPRFSNFKARVLDRARVELARTDMPFTFELERQNQLVQRIKFLFGYDTTSADGNGQEELQEAQLVENSQHSEHSKDSENTDLHAEPAWMQALRLVGVSQRSIKQIAKQLEAQEYPLEYVDFVLARIGKQHRLGKVKKPAGAIYKALIEKYLLEEFLAEQKVIRTLASKKSTLATRVKAPVPVLEEVAFPLREVREMYENPGPFMKHQLRETSFEQHVEKIYLMQGFALVQRKGEEWLVKIDSSSAS
jgi:hypothetical protein